MQCISILQPWATLWLLEDPDEKWFETRSWRTRHRGPLLVHAGKKKDKKVVKAFTDFAAVLHLHGIYSIDQLQFGALIGRVDLVGCHSMKDMPEPSAKERAVGFWDPHRFAWERAANPVLFKRSIPYKGALRLFDIPDEKWNAPENETVRFVK